MISVLSLTSKNLPSCLLYKNISECFKYFSIPHWDEGTLSVEVLRRHYRREFPIMAPGTPLADFCSGHGFGKACFLQHTQLPWCPAAEAPVASPVPSTHARICP